MERLMRKVRKGGEDECWPWIGQIDRLGYGSYVMVGTQHLRAHRAAYTLHVGPIPAGLHVLHSCDNRACCNPRHLSVGTHQDNMRDRTARGRDWHPPSEHGPAARFTAEQVEGIRRRLAAGERNADLAREFGVRPETISRIRTGYCWKAENALLTRWSEALKECLAHHANEVPPEKWQRFCGLDQQMREHFSE
jgi:hypothetical protein